MGSIAAGDEYPALLQSHFLVVSIPAPGHLIPSTSLAHQLAAAGTQVTYLTTGYVFPNLQHQGDHQYVPSGSSSSSSTSFSFDGSGSGSGRIRFEGLLECKEEYEMTLAKVMKWQQALSDEEMQAALEQKFLQLQPRPCCIVADMILGWVQDVAEKLRVPRIALITVPAKDLAFILRVPELVERGELPFTAAGAKKKDITLPGMAAIPAEDVWESFADGGHPNHQKIVKAAVRVKESASIIVNTFEELEAETFKALRTDFTAANIKVPEILPIVLSGIPKLQSRHGSETTSNRDLDQMSTEVEKWLETQAPASVIYVSFGSLATLPEKEIENLALALEAAGYPFLWVYRPPGKPQVNYESPNSPAQCNSQAHFPPGFQERVSGRAMLVYGWAPQPQILTHEAIGAFLTHCGWNSVLESVCAGVPMLAWPIFADQNINARFVTDTAQVGLRIHRNADNTVHQDEIEKVLKQMMEDEEGTSARSNALKFQLLAQKNVADGGASRTNLHKVVQQCTSQSSHP